MYFLFTVIGLLPGGSGTGERPYTYALDSAAIGVGFTLLCTIQFTQSVRLLLLQFISLTNENIEEVGTKID